MSHSILRDHERLFQTSNVQADLNSHGSLYNLCATSQLGSAEISRNPDNFCAVIGCMMLTNINVHVPSDCENLEKSTAWRVDEILHRVMMMINKVSLFDFQEKNVRRARIA